MPLVIDVYTYPGHKEEMKPVHLSTVGNSGAKMHAKGITPVLCGTGVMRDLTNGVKIINHGMQCV
jgi:hypothetical protein